MVEFMVGPLLESPERVGKPLRNQPEGYWAARRGPYRIVYGLSRRRGTVEVVRIEHRADVHRPR